MLKKLKMGIRELSESIVPLSEKIANRNNLMNVLSDKLNGRDLGKQWDSVVSSVARWTINDSVIFDKKSINVFVAEVRRLELDSSNIDYVFDLIAGIASLVAFDFSLSQKYLRKCLMLAKLLKKEQEDDVLLISHLLELIEKISLVYSEVTIVQLKSKIAPLKVIVNKMHHENLDTNFFRQKDLYQYVQNDLLASLNEIEIRLGLESNPYFLDVRSIDSVHYDCWESNILKLITQSADVSIIMGHNSEDVVQFSLRPLSRTEWVPIAQFVKYVNSIEKPKGKKGVLIVLSCSGKGWKEISKYYEYVIYHEFTIYAQSYIPFVKLFVISRLMKFDVYKSFYLAKTFATFVGLNLDGFHIFPAEKENEVEATT